MDEEEKQKMVVDYLSEQDAEEAVELVPDEVLESVRSEARDEGRRSVLEEADRMLEAAEGDKERAFDGLTDEEKTVEDVDRETKAALKKERDELQARLDKIEEGREGGQEFQPSDGEETSADGERDYEKEYNSDPELQEEFQDAEHYEAWAKRHEE